jgi:hypothetical protein
MRAEDCKLQPEVREDVDDRAIETFPGRGKWSVGGQLSLS